MDRAGALDRLRKCLCFVGALGGQTTQHQRLFVDLLGHVVRIAVQGVDFVLPGDVPNGHLLLLA